jgi:hypothetical protein
MAFITASMEQNRIDSEKQIISSIINNSKKLNAEGKVPVIGPNGIEDMNGTLIIPKQSIANMSNLVLDAGSSIISPQSLTYYTHNFYDHGSSVTDYPMSNADFDLNDENGMNALSQFAQAGPAGYGSMDAWSAVGFDFKWSQYMPQKTVPIYVYGGYAGRNLGAGSVTLSNTIDVELIDVTNHGANVSSANCLSKPYQQFYDEVVQGQISVQLNPTLIPGHEYVVYVKTSWHCWGIWSGRYRV